VAAGCLFSVPIRARCDNRRRARNDSQRGSEEEEMNSIADTAYVTAVLLLYTDLPETPRRASSYDKVVARSLFDKGVPLEVVESAMLLGCLRRCTRPPEALPLPRIRSLAYFSPVIDELQRQAMPAGYTDYLRHKACQVFRKTAVSPEGRRGIAPPR
jgi:hypothetical protein